MNNNNRNSAYDGPMGIFADLEESENDSQKQDKKQIKPVRKFISQAEERRYNRNRDKQKRERQFEDDDGWD